MSELGGGPAEQEPQGLDDVFFLRRARPGLRDLWIEGIDWAPTVATAVGVVLLPYVMARLMDPVHRPALLSGNVLSFLAGDRVVRGVVLAGVAVLLSLWFWKVLQLVLERRRRIVRLDLHEIECWPDRELKYLLVRDVVGAHVGRKEQRSRWWVLRAPRQAVVLFVRRPGDQVIDRVRFDWSRHELVSAGSATAPWAGLPGSTADQEGNRVGADVIALLRRRRSGMGLPVEELPELDVDISSDCGVRLIGNRDQMVLHVSARVVTIPGWAVRSAALIAGGKAARSPLQLALELDPRCGEFHLLVGLGHGPADAQIVEWCQLLAARFDKDPGVPRSRP